MINNKKIIAIIPARGGSKGLPGKNIRSLAGKPLIAWTIDKAKKSKYIDKVIVSTEDNEIAEISRKYGAEVPVLRPEELAKDDSPTIDAIMHIINWFESKEEYFDIIILLEPTSPLRKENDIDNAVELFIENIDHAGSLVSVGEVHMENPHITKKIENGYVKPLIEIGKNLYQRQQLPKVYFPYGVIYLALTIALKKNKTFYLERTIPYFIERWQNYEIDDIYDFICIEAILKYKPESEA
ncbi:MAG: acylneuraminate cytidylyltransferase [Candidatus Methanoperedens nitroreducens]|uniref:Acylneuraminate cytidylyltransferase n=1 Tax=Candidatus Methanoperedens nitratireducens TaxID=1392998 RepID=A0A0P8DWG2_9EURY|nr:acylneuraminate cytidylyltransferase family protein [Candidatus Methanoperedens sp. BLZ2]KAB2946572.1 MAG: acylneuraminate cytidylyltransferase family protein [Candidatus Methanoperedens sp.]KPQ41956.1 MAG: acylneuraminate cytidylyltransferase [Candidatus Methanoperedens sp. BLZ1]MBZ0175074.1 acylneuraminate cytidylyltransferase family protein [Candidatus Methanoperedens nitroreducens]